MKRAIIKLICFAVLAAVALSLVGCLGRSDEEREKAIQYDENGIGYIGLAVYDENRKYIKGAKDYRVVRLPVDASSESCEITLSEPYFGMSVPPDFDCRFYAVGDGYVEMSTKDVTKETPVYTVYVHLNSKMRDIGLPNHSVLYKKQENGEYKMYRIEMYFFCPEDNKYYYSEDGVLYYKSNKLPLSYHWVNYNFD